MGNLLLTVAAAILLLLCACAGVEQWRIDAEKIEDPVQKGRVLYEHSCNRCHALYMPQSYSRGDWRYFVRKYAPRARLREGEDKLVLLYLRQNARGVTPSTKAPKSE